MKKQSELSYADSQGNVIEFYPVEMKAEDKEQMFAFRVINNEKLTREVLAYTKRHTVNRRSIYPRVLAVANIIKNNLQNQ
ncbi:MAG: hypothetical protein WC467_02335 [Patescibacteria group bacterium]